MKDAKAKGGNYVIPLVVYDLPNRDCAALASNGEFLVKDGGPAKYKEYIASVKKEIQAAPDQKFVLVWGMCHIAIDEHALILKRTRFLGQLGYQYGIFTRPECALSSTNLTLLERAKMSRSCSSLQRTHRLGPEGDEPA